LISNYVTSCEFELYIWIDELCSLDGIGIVYVGLLRKVGIWEKSHLKKVWPVVGNI